MGDSHRLTFAFRFAKFLSPLHIDRSMMIKIARPNEFHRSPVHLIRLPTIWFRYCYHIHMYTMHIGCDDITIGMLLQSLLSLENKLYTEIFQNQRKKMSRHWLLTRQRKEKYAVQKLDATRSSLVRVEDQICRRKFA